MAEKSKTPKKLRNDVAEKHTLSGGMAEAGRVNTPSGLVDLSSIDLPAAERLAANPNFPYLEKKGTAATKPAPDPKPSGKESK